jgi:DNA-binding NtrC family response regulator
MINKVQPLFYIIDKSKPYQKIIFACLKALKLSNIEVFDNGELCYSSATKAADFIILDYNFGKENWNGIEFMEEYSRIHPKTGFIFLSSGLGVEIAVDSLRKGAIDYIPKSKLGLARLVKQVEGIKDYYKKERLEKFQRHLIMLAIITFSTLTALMSFFYSIG